MPLNLSVTDAGQTFTLDFLQLEGSDAGGNTAPFSIDPLTGNATFALSAVNHSVPLQWQISADPATQNQLIVSSAGTNLNLPGQIICADPKSMQYDILDNTGGDFTGAQINLGGQYKLDSQLQNLLFTTTSGQALTIAGDPPVPGVGNMQHSQSPDGNQDLLQFLATTINPGTPGTIYPALARITFEGAFQKANDGHLEFYAVGSGTIAAPDLVLRLAGDYNGVAAGLEVHVQGRAVTLALTVSGQFTTSRDPHDQITWSLDLGFAKNRLSADVQIDGHQSLGAGTLKLDGKLHLSSGGGTPLQATLALQLAYDVDTKDGDFHLEVAAAGSTFGTTGNYQITVNGSYVYNGNTLTLSFEAQYQSGKPTVTLDLAYKGPGLQARISAIYGKNVALTISFSIDLIYENGHLRVDRSKV